MNLKDALWQTISEARKEFSPYNLLSEPLKHLPKDKPVYIYALGKAAFRMTEAVLLHNQEKHLFTIKDGLVITPYGYAEGPLSGITVLEAGHPVPDENSLAAGEATLNFMRKLEEDDILLVLLSGGGSALMEKPAPGISFGQIVNITKELLKIGADIETLNTERKKLSAVKGGKLLEQIQAKLIFIIAMSDVPDNKPKFIASNPFLPETEKTDFNSAVYVFYDFNLQTDIPFPSVGKNIVYKIIADNRSFCEALKAAALKAFPVLPIDNIHIFSNKLASEAKKTGKEIAALAKLIFRQKRRKDACFTAPCLLIFGGETYVKVTGNGKGGRCTEIALAATEGLSGLTDCALLTYATDGKDGFCDAAGAVVDSSSFQALRKQGIVPEAALANNDSYNALKAIAAIIPSEATGINVNDVVLLYVG